MFFYRLRSFVRFNTHLRTVLSWNNGSELKTVRGGGGEGGGYFRVTRGACVWLYTKRSPACSAFAAKLQLHRWGTPWYCGNDRFTVGLKCNIFKIYNIRKWLGKHINKKDSPCLPVSSAGRLQVGQQSTCHTTIIIAHKMPMDTSNTITKDYSPEQLARNSWKPASKRVCHLKEDMHSNTNVQVFPAGKYYYILYITYHNIDHRGAARGKPVHTTCRLCTLCTLFKKFRTTENKFRSRKGWWWNKTI